MRFKSSRKILSGFMTLVLIFVLVSVSATTSFAASSGNKKITTYLRMGISLSKGESGVSNEVLFEVSGLPENAVITKLEINGGSLKGQGAIISQYLNIRSSNGRSEEIPWRGADNTTVTADSFVGALANGTYALSFSATCIGGAIINGNVLDVGSRTYSKPYIVIYWKV